MTTRSPLISLVQKFAERDAGTAARDLETMEEAEATAILTALPVVSAARLFPHLQVNYAAALLTEASPDLVEAVVKWLKPEQAVSILLSLPTDGRAALLDRLQDDEPAIQTESANRRFITKEALRQLVLRDLEELSYQEIADVLEVPVGTVRSRISRARSAFIAAPSRTM